MQTPGAGPGAVSLGVEVGYDDNVFRMDHGPLRRQGSPVSSAAFRWDRIVGAGMTLRYGFEAVRFSADAATENHVRHTSALSGSGRRGGLAWEFSSQTIAVNGDDRSPVFGLSRSCFAISPPRERRDQWQNRSAARCRQNLGAAFVQGVATFAGYDLRTSPQVVAGVDNYVDRADTAGGIEVGRVLSNGLSVAAGIRAGQQFQDRDGGRKSDRSNHYRRLLLSFDGPLAGRFRIVGAVGPARHTYAINSTGPARIDRWYADLGLNVSLTARDTLHVSTKRAQGVASTGNVSSQDLASTVQWRHRFSAVWAASVAAKVAGGIYDGAMRDDEQTVGAGTVTWRTKHGPEVNLTCGGEVSRDCSLRPDPARDYQRRHASLATNWTF
ncbi:hypothetical protein [Horticoccus sp. 23ND18S-11]